MVRVLWFFDKLAGMAAFSAAAAGDVAGDGTVDNSKGGMESATEREADTPLASPVDMGAGVVAMERGMSNERMPNGLTSASGCHDSKDFSGGGARPGGSNGYALLAMQDGD